jgi:hypothetical protein
MITHNLYGAVATQVHSIWTPEADMVSKFISSATFATGGVACWSIS